jgi:glycosyltransferase involved in cell wall biosynthesis
METRISVIIPTYKRPALLMECIKALARQTFDKAAFEVIVVSDGPDRITQKLVTSWKHTGLLDIEYIPLDRKKGPAAARNTGWKIASGELIAFTDDDCQPEPSWLEELWDASQTMDAALFSGRVIVPLSDAPTDYEWNTAKLETAEFITANCACQRSVMERTGGFDERFEMAWREDSDLYFNARWQHIPLIHLNNAVVVHPVRKASWGVSLKEQKKTMYNALLYKKYPQEYKQLIREKPPVLYYLMVLLPVIAVIMALLQNYSGALIMGAGWLLLVMYFAWMRLRHKSHAWPHVFEMMVTSACIPFLSVYWNWYGSWKYRVLLW